MNMYLDPVIKNYRYYFGDKVGKPVVWEVGSRDGHDGVELARRIYAGEAPWFWANARVVALEPNPAQAKIIAKEYPEIELHKVAASNETGKADFIVYEGDEGAVGSSSLRLDWKEGDHEGKIIKVKTVRLEELIGKDEKIDIMKIDVEGHSLEVLEGMGDRVKNVKVFHIETEKWTDSNIKVKEFMLMQGFTLVDEREQYSGMPDQTWVQS